MAEDQSLILELYKTAVEMADRVSARRAGANNFFLTLNTVLAAVVGIVSAARKPPAHGGLPTFDAFGLCATAVAGIILAVVWWALLRYYRRLSRAKWNVITRMEELLPARPFSDEWGELRPLPVPVRETVTVPNRRRINERLRLRVAHREATVVEQVVPFVFVALYIVLGLRVVLQ